MFNPVYLFDYGWCETNP